MLGPSAHGQRPKPQDLQRCYLCGGLADCTWVSETVAPGCGSVRGLLLRSTGAARALHVTHARAQGASARDVTLYLHVGFHNGTRPAVGCKLEHQRVGGKQGHAVGHFTISCGL